MHEKRDCQPGLLLLSGERVLVCGGGGGGDGGVGSITTEILQLPRADGDSKGVWTLLIQQFTHRFFSTYLVKFNNRVIAVGELFINMLLICQKSV